LLPPVVSGCMTKQWRADLCPRLARWRRTDSDLSARLGVPVHFIFQQSDGGQYVEKDQDRMGCYR
jgi:hypothetical protein